MTESLTLVDTHIAPLLLPEAIEAIPAWGPVPSRLEASATWLPGESSTGQSFDNIAATLRSLPPVVLPESSKTSCFQVSVHRNSYPYKADVSVSVDGIYIQVNSPSEKKCITLAKTVSVRDVLNAIQEQTTWKSCHLVLAPPSNIASPLAASDDPSVPYDWTPQFLEPGDWVDMGDRRIECDNDDIKIINMKNGSHSIMKLNPNAIHGGYFEICSN